MALAQRETLLLLKGDELPQKLVLFLANREASLCVLCFAREGENYSWVFCPSLQSGYSRDSKGFFAVLAVILVSSNIFDVLVFYLPSML